MAKIFIKPHANLHFKADGKAVEFKACQRYQVDEKEIAHLDKKDYHVVTSDKEEKTEKK